MLMNIFAKKTDLNTHIGSVHEGKKPFKCGFCNYTCSQEPNLQRNITSVHEKIKSFKSEVKEVYS